MSDGLKDRLFDFQKSRRDRDALDKIKRRTNRDFNSLAIGQVHASESLLNHCFHGGSNDGRNFDDDFCSLGHVALPIHRLDGPVRDRANVILAQSPFWGAFHRRCSARPNRCRETIQADTNVLTLNPGDVFSETITVTIPRNAGPAKADMYFLADTTASMTSELTAVQDLEPRGTQRNCCLHRVQRQRLCAFDRCAADRKPRAYVLNTSAPTTRMKEGVGVVEASRTRTMKDWVKNRVEFRSLKPNHLSCANLILS